MAPNGWVIHRNKDVFGDDAEEYRPERWLDESKKGDMRTYRAAILFRSLYSCLR